MQATDTWQFFPTGLYTKLNREGSDNGLQLARVLLQTVTSRTISACYYLMKRISTGIWTATSVIEFCKNHFVEIMALRWISIFCMI